MKDNMKARPRDRKVAVKNATRLHDGLEVVEEDKGTPADPYYEFTNTEKRLIKEMAKGDGAGGFVRALREVLKIREDQRIHY